MKKICIALHVADSTLLLLFFFYFFFLIWMRQWWLMEGWLCGKVYLTQPPLFFSLFLSEPPFLLPLHCKFVIVSEWGFDEWVSFSLSLPMIHRFYFSLSTYTHTHHHHQQQQQHKRARSLFLLLLLQHPRRCSNSTRPFFLSSSFRYYEAVMIHVSDQAFWVWRTTQLCYGEATLSVAVAAMLLLCLFTLFSDKQYTSIWASYSSFTPPHS